MSARKEQTFKPFTDEEEKIKESPMVFEESPIKITSEEVDEMIKPFDQMDPNEELREKTDSDALLNVKPKIMKKDLSKISEKNETEN